MSAGRIEPRAFARVGGLWLWSLGFNSPLAVADAFMALAGVAAETGVVPLICLDNATREMRARSASDGRQEKTLGSALTEPGYGRMMNGKILGDVPSALAIG